MKQGGGRALRGVKKEDDIEGDPPNNVPATTTLPASASSPVVPDPICSGSSCRGEMDRGNTDWRPYTGYRDNENGESKIAPLKRTRRDGVKNEVLQDTAFDDEYNDDDDDDKAIVSATVQVVAAVAAAVSTSTTTKRKSEQSRDNNHCQKKLRNTIQNSKNNNSFPHINDGNSTTDGIYAADGDAGENNDTNDFSRRNGRRAAAKGKKKYSDDDNDDNDDDHMGASSDDDNYHHEEEEEEEEVVVTSDDDDDDHDGSGQKYGDNIMVTTDTTMTCRGTIILNKQDEKWNVMYRRLLKYKKKYQSTSVPSRYRDDPELGNWVIQQRLKYKDNSLSAARIDCLTSIGFVWTCLPYNPLIWPEMYKRLVAYKKKYKTTCVPRSSDRQLDQWVRTQRTGYNKLTAERKDQLNSIGFVWNKLDANWTERYEQLVEYKNQYNSTCVPTSYNPQLAKWIYHQRTLYNTNSSRLTADRIEQLNLIGFSWSVSNDERWTEMYRQLVAYKEEHKTTCATHSYNPQLAKWVSKQRVNYNANRSNLTTDRIDRLNKIDFVWKLK